MPSASATPESTSAPESSATSVTTPGSACTGKLVPSIAGSSGVTLTVTSVVVGARVQHADDRGDVVPVVERERAVGADRVEDAHAGEGEVGRGVGRGIHQVDAGGVETAHDRLLQVGDDLAAARLDVHDRRHQAGGEARRARARAARPAGTSMPVMPGASTAPSSPKICSVTSAATAVGFDRVRMLVRPTVVAPPASQIDPLGSAQAAAEKPRKSLTSTTCDCAPATSEPSAGAMRSTSGAADVPPVPASEVGDRRRVERRVERRRPHRRHADRDRGVGVRAGLVAEAQRRAGADAQLVGGTGRDRDRPAG